MTCQAGIRRVDVASKRIHQSSSTTEHKQAMEQADVGCDATSLSLGNRLGLGIVVLVIWKTVRRFAILPTVRFLHSASDHAMSSSWASSTRRSFERVETLLIKADQDATEVDAKALRRKVLEHQQAVHKLLRKEELAHAAVT
eukprot:280391-Amphidinium_carterae.1